MTYSLPTVTYNVADCEGKRLIDIITELYPLGSHHGILKVRLPPHPESPKLYPLPAKQLFGKVVNYDRISTKDGEPYYRTSVSERVAASAVDYVEQERARLNGKVDYPVPIRFKSRKAIVDAIERGNLFEGDMRELFDRDTVNRLEREFWEETKASKDRVFSSYASDQDVKMPNPPARCPAIYNLHNVGDLLAAQKAEKKVYTGMNTVFSYLGRSSVPFPWHREDGNFSSVNLQLDGAPKIWYAIGTDQREKLEEVLKTLDPEGYEKCPNLLQHKNLFFPPETLESLGITVGRLVQYPGEFVITFPDGAHAGVNTGLNYNVAINAVPPQWEQMARDIPRCGLNCVVDDPTKTRSDTAEVLQGDFAALGVGMYKW